MDGKPHCFVSGILATTLWISRLGGIAPLRFMKITGGWLMRRSEGWTIYGRFLVSVFCLGALMNYLLKLESHSFKDHDYHTKMNSLMWVSLTWDLVAMLTFGINASANMVSTVACLDQVQKVNNELNDRYMTMRLKRRKLLIVIWLVVTVSVYCMHYGQMLARVDVTEQLLYCWTCLFRIGCVFIIHLRGLLFVLITQQVMYTFKNINAQLGILLNGIDDVTISPLRLEAVRRAARGYLSACDVVREVDRNNSTEVLMILGAILVNIVTAMYFFIYILVGKFIQMSRHGVISSVMALLTSILHIFNLVALVEPCHSTHTEKETTHELVSCLMYGGHSPSDPLAAELDQFYKLLILDKASYTLLQVSNMSRGMVAAILSSVVTYITIMVKL